MLQVRRMSIQDSLSKFATNATSVFKQPTAVMNALPDTSQFIGPIYDYSGELKSPSEIGIERGGSFEKIGRAGVGVDYYVSALGYGQSMGLSKSVDGMEQSPMGLNFFLKVADAKYGAACSNGASMYEYVSTIPVGIPGPLGDQLAKEMRGVRLQGLAPGIINDAGAALNPAPFFSAAIGSGFPQCKQMTAPVGDAAGRLRSKNKNVTRPWIDPKTEKLTRKDGKYYATHWVFDKWISAEDYKKTKKVYPIKDKKGKVIEDFASPVGGSQVAAGVLFAALFLGLVAFTAGRK